MTQRARSLLDLLDLEWCGRQQPCGIAHQIVHAEVAERHAEVLRGHVLELVGLIHDERGARGDHFAVGALADRRVSAEQMVVDDDHVGFGRALAHQRQEAVTVTRTLGAETGVGIGGDLVPERKILGQVTQLGAVAGLRPRRPLLDHRQQDVVADLDQSAVRSGIAVHRVAIILPAMETEVVRPSLHQRGCEGNADGLAQRTAGL